MENKKNLPDVVPAQYRVRVDGTIHTLTNPEPTANDILTLSGKSPDEFAVMFTTSDGQKRLLMGDDNIDLSAPGIEEFGLISTARRFAVQIEETQLELPQRHMTGSQILQAAGKSSDDYALVQLLPGEVDRFIAPDQTVDLAMAGVEKFSTPPLDEITIFVNTRPKKVKGKTLSFAAVVALAFPNPPTGPNVLFTVTYNKAGGLQPSGNLAAGECVAIQEGTIFNVTPTDKS